MAAAGLPGQIRSTVTQSTTTQPAIQFDPLYLKTNAGLLKIFQVSFSLLGFIFIQASIESASPRGKFYSWISMTAFFFSGILLGLYLFHVVEKYQQKVPWLKIELGFCVLWTFFFLLASSLTIGSWGNGMFIGAGSIGIRTTLAYGMDVYLKWQSVRRGCPAQGPCVTPSQADAGITPTVGLRITVFTIQCPQQDRSVSLA